MKHKRKFITVSIILFSVLLIYHLKLTNFSLISYDQRQSIKKYIFPYKKIKDQEKLILKYSPIIREMSIKENNERIKVLNDYKLSNNKILSIYPLSGFHYGIHENYTSSAYLDFYKDNLIILSSRGILTYSQNLKSSHFLKQIENNINEFIGIKHFQKNRWFSIKDLLVHNEKIFVSFTEEIKDYCWNTSIIYGEINFKKINFKKLFSSNQCIHTKDNIDKEFNAHQSGGRMIGFDNEHIILTTGDYRSRSLAQNIESVNGKIIKININNFNQKIISMGHRNPQGLYYDKENNFLLETEHGPRGGDEINLIPINYSSSSKILNYGWPISSAGKHYVSTDEKIRKYPLHNSHEKFGFIEPLKSFVPSIAISEIEKIGNKKYVFGSLRDKSIYFFKLNDENKIINIERVEVFERVRDLKFYNNELYLFLENSSSIGIINLN